LQKPSADGPLVSVIMPVRNASAYLEAAIRALTQQTYRNLQIVIAVDKSSDGTLEATHRYAALDDRIEVIAGLSATGVAAMRNAALEASRGQFVWFTDVDDEWSPELVASMIGIALERDVDMVTASYYQISDRRVVLRGPTASEDFGATALKARIGDVSIEGYLWNKLFNMRVVPPSPFPEELTTHSDLAGFLRIASGVSKVSTLSHPLYAYYVRGGSLLHSNYARGLTDLMVCENLARGVLDDEHATRSTQFRLEVVALGAARKLSGVYAILPHSEATRLKEAVSLKDIGFSARQGQGRLAAWSILLRLSPTAFSLTQRTIRRSRKLVGWALLLASHERRLGVTCPEWVTGLTSS
jgi:glycosyltransferase involved in cell wall biosynthesis